jgi:hypothetical protein
MVDFYSPALDSGFRRNDASRQAISWFVMPTKVGAFRYPGLLMIVLNSYMFSKTAADRGNSGKFNRPESLFSMS